MENVEYTIDAQGKRLGRLASEVAVLLMGKNLPNFSRDTAPAVSVTIDNIALLDLTQKQKDTKMYDHYTGYPSGRKEYPMSKIIDDKGHGELFKKAVYGMLPGNKLRSIMMKNLHINN